MEEEIWKPTKEDPRYEVSNFGRVRSFAIHGKTAKTSHILKTTHFSNGYVSVGLGGNHPNRLLHRLVAEVSRLFGISFNRIRRAIETGKICDGYHWRFATREEAEDMVRNNL